MTRRPPPRRLTTSRTRKGKVLARLEPEEVADVLRSLLGRHPELVAEAEEIAKARITDVDAEAVAEAVEHAVLSVDIDALSTRAGRKRWGYVEPTEAAWELLGEAIDPFLEQMTRHIELGFEAAAVGTCAGIVLGLYRCRGKNSDQVLGWAGEFPTETASHALATLARESTTKQRRSWRLSDATAHQVPEWADMIGGPLDRAAANTAAQNAPK